MNYSPEIYLKEQTDRPLVVERLVSLAEVFVTVVTMVAILVGGLLSPDDEIDLLRVCGECFIATSHTVAQWLE